MKLKVSERTVNDLSTASKDSVIPNHALFLACILHGSSYLSKSGIFGFVIRLRFVLYEVGISVSAGLLNF